MPTLQPLGGWNNNRSPVACSQAIQGWVTNVLKRYCERTFNWRPNVWYLVGLPWTGYEVTPFNKNEVFFITILPLDTTVSDWNNHIFGRQKLFTNTRLFATARMFICKPATHLVINPEQVHFSVDSTDEQQLGLAIRSQTGHFVLELCWFTTLR